MKTFKSKYTNTCTTCGKRIEIGEMIAFVSSKQIYHFNCQPGIENLYNETDEDGYMFVDLETGGLDPKNCAIVQIAAIATDKNFLIHDSWSRLIRPGQFQTIGERSIEIHGLTRERLKNEEYEAVVLPEFLSFCRLFPNHRFAGYNCPFDLKFLEAAYDRNHLDGNAYLLPAHDLLTRARAKLAKADLPNHQLSTIAEHFGFSASAAHDALADLYLTVQIARNTERVAA